MNVLCGGGQRSVELGDQRYGYKMLIYLLWTAPTELWVRLARLDVCCPLTLWSQKKVCYVLCREELSEWISLRSGRHSTMRSSQKKTHSASEGQTPPGKGQTRNTNSFRKSETWIMTESDDGKTSLLLRLSNNTFDFRITHNVKYTQTLQNKKPPLKVKPACKSKENCIWPKVPMK